MGDQDHQQEEAGGALPDRSLAAAGQPPGALCPCCAARQRANGVPPLALAQPGDEEMLALEVEVLREVSHPNIIHLYKCVALPPSAVAAKTVVAAC